MGLDMYLTGREYAGYENPSQRLGFNVQYYILEVGYWRKSNHIHNWFVQNCQNGVDECQETHVTSEQLRTLLSLVKKVLLLRSEEYAMEKLPPASGFFFGSTEISDWYWEDLERTVQILENALQYEDKMSFYYHASW